jgi:hypothetical protein
LPLPIPPDAPIPPFASRANLPEGEDEFESVLDEIAADVLSVWNTE